MAHLQLIPNRAGKRPFRRDPLAELRLAVLNQLVQRESQFPPHSIMKIMERSLQITDFPVGVPDFKAMESKTMRSEWTHRTTSLA